MAIPAPGSSQGIMWTDIENLLRSRSLCFIVPHAIQFWDFQFGLPVFDKSDRIIGVIIFWYLFHLTCSVNCSKTPLESKSTNRWPLQLFA
jgi:hypothetical protein